jgi:NitT/TauT family transport system substrate-binding protein
MDWSPSPYHAPFYVALAKGWYDEGGLEVTIGETKGSGQAAQLVGAGDAQFGYVDGPVLLSSVVSGAPLKSVALTFAKSATGYAYAIDTGIKTPKDLEGKTFAALPFGTSTQLWPAFAQVNGIDVSKVTVVTVDAAASTQTVAARRADFTSAVAGADEFVITKAGRPAAFLGHSEHGLSYVGHAVVASATTIQQKPDVVRSFVGATVRGYDFTKANMDEALDLVIKAAPEVPRDKGESHLKASIPLWSTPSGAQTAQQWQSTIDLIARYSKFEKTPSAGDLFTNDFLPK